MHGNTPQKPRKDSAFFRELYEMAEIIERWTPAQRKTYLTGLREREKEQGKTLYRNIIKIMLSDSRGRKNFIRLYKEGKL